MIYIIYLLLFIGIALVLLWYFFGIPLVLLWYSLGVGFRIVLHTKAVLYVIKLLLYVFNGLVTALQIRI